MKSPKSEVRSPKWKGSCVASGSEERSVFWDWGSERTSGLVLHEGSAQAGPPQDLEERVTEFGEAIVRFVRKIPRGPATDRLIDQLVGAGTSLGANYLEARDGVSRKDFKNRVGTNRKESKETMFFIRLVADAEPSFAGEARVLWREARELNRIFGAIWRK
jgi:four helix bundle protein